MYKHKSGAAKWKKKVELDAKNAKNRKIAIFFFQLSQQWYIREQFFV
jgi:hypothetical protein